MPIALDYSDQILLVSLVVGVVSVILTFLLLATNVSLDITSRSRLLAILQKRSRQFQRIRTVTDSILLCRSAPRLRRLDRWLRVLFLVPMLGVLLASLYGSVTPLDWVWVVGTYVASVVVMWLLSVAWSRNPERLAALASRPSPENWAGAELHTAAGFLLRDDTFYLAPLLIYFPILGATLSVLAHGTTTQSEADLAVIAIIEASFVAFVLVVLLPGYRDAEARFFVAVRRCAPSLRVQVHLFVRGLGRVVESGELWEIGGACEVRGELGEVHRVPWGKVELLVAAEFIP